MIEQQTELAAPQPSHLPVRDENQLADLCDLFEGQIRSHLRMISGYHHATVEGVEDLEEGLGHLSEMIKTTLKETPQSQLEPLLRQLLNLGALVRSIGQNAVACSATSDQLCKRLVRQMRESDLGNRRETDRTPFRLPCKLRVDGHVIPCRTHDLSSGGCKIDLDQMAPVSISMRQQVELELDDVGRLAAEVVGLSGKTCHLAFREAEPDAVRYVESMIHAINQHYVSTMNRVQDLCATLGDKADAATLFATLSRETTGLRAVRILDENGADRSSHLVPQLQNTEVWPTEPNPAVHGKAITPSPAPLCPDLGTLMVMHVEVGSGDTAYVQVLADMAFVLRQGRLRAKSPLAELNIH